MDEENELLEESVNEELASDDLSQQDNSAVGNGYSANRFNRNNRRSNQTYDDRINESRQKLEESKQRAAKAKENLQNTEGKNFFNRTSDRLENARAQRSVSRNERELRRNELNKKLHPIEAKKQAVKKEAEARLKKKIKNQTLLLLLKNPIFLIVVGIVLIILISLLLGAVSLLFKFDSEASSGGIASSRDGENCGFSISVTSFSKSEYKEKVCEYAKSNSRAKEFCDNSDSIYDLSNASGINPELVIVRAVVEGFSPAYDKSGNLRETYRYNHWGIGCGNKQGLSACKTYSSFLVGVQGFLDVIDGYDSLINMMTSYAFIGHNWGAGNSSDGECYYFDYMKDYYANTPEAQESKVNAAAACAAGGTGIATTKYDQDAYALYQVDNKMGGVREKIFGLKLDQGGRGDCNAVAGDGINTGTMTHPCPEVVRISSEFGWREQPLPGASKNHKGMDLAAPQGTPVYAADGGKVIWAQYTGNAGKYIAIDHGDGLITQYMHLYKMYVKVGDKVTKGQQIGEVGNTGNSTGPHLHFGIITNGTLNSDTAIYENPRNYIKF